MPPVLPYLIFPCLRGVIPNVIQLSVIANQCAHWFAISSVKSYAGDSHDQFENWSRNDKKS